MNMAQAGMAKDAPIAEKGKDQEIDGRRQTL